MYSAICDKEHVNLLFEKNELTCISYYENKDHVINLMKVRKR